MPDDWSRFLANVSDAATELPPRNPRTLATVFPRRPGYPSPTHYGSSLNFDLELRLFYPALRVPERECVLLDDGNGGPGDGKVRECETHGAICPCRVCHGKIAPPSRREYDPRPLMATMIRQGYTTDAILQSVKESAERRRSGPKEERSLLVCPACGRSAFDDLLQLQLDLAGGFPPREKRRPG